MGENSKKYLLSFYTLRKKLRVYSNNKRIFEGLINYINREKL